MRRKTLWGLGVRTKKLTCCPASRKQPKPTSITGPFVNSSLTNTITSKGHHVLRVIVIFLAIGDEAWLSMISAPARRPDRDGR